jgi:hypothetical protein
MKNANTIPNTPPINNMQMPNAAIELPEYPLCVSIFCTIGGLKKGGTRVNDCIGTLY